MSFTSEQKLTPRLLIFPFPRVSPIAQGLMPKWPFQEACTQHSDFLGCPRCSVPCSIRACLFEAINEEHYFEGT